MYLVCFTKPTKLWIWTWRSQLQKKKTRRSAIMNALKVIYWVVYYIQSDQLMFMWLKFLSFYFFDFLLGNWNLFDIFSELSWRAYQMTNFHCSIKILKLQMLEFHFPMFPILWVDYLFTYLFIFGCWTGHWWFIAPIWQVLLSFFSLYKLSYLV